MWHYTHRMPKIKWESIREADCKLPHSQAISCIGYNVNLTTAVAAILFFEEGPKSIASEVLLIERPYQNVKPIGRAIFKISRSQARLFRLPTGV